MIYRVSLSAEAEQDLDDILAWLMREAAGKTGLGWFDELRTAIASLTQTPRRCSLAPENELYPFEVRQLLYGTRPHVYRILFTVGEEEVTILHVRHGRRPPLDKQ